MKAVVVEIKNGKAAVLCKDGTVRTVPDKGYRVGMEVGATSVRKMPRRWASIAAAFALFILLGGSSAYAFCSPYAYVTVDVNPSIGYVLNRFDKVIAVQAYNQEGNSILEGVEYDTGKHSDIRSVLNSTLEQLYSQEYIGVKNKDYIVIATSAKTEKKNQELSAMSDELINQYRSLMENSVTSEIFQVEESIKKEADELGTTMGRVGLIKQVSENCEAFGEEDVEELLNMSIPELVEFANVPENENTIIVIQDNNKDSNGGMVVSTGGAIVNGDGKPDGGQSGVSGDALENQGETTIDSGNANKNEGKPDGTIPDGSETQNPDSGDAQQPENNPGGDETQNAGSEETQKPGSDETQNPGSDETQKPGSGETQEPEEGQDGETSEENQDETGDAEDNLQEDTNADGSTEVPEVTEDDLITDNNTQKAEKPSGIIPDDYQPEAEGDTEDANQAEEQPVFEESETESEIIE